MAEHAATWDDAGFDSAARDEETVRRGFWVKVKRFGAVLPFAVSRFVLFSSKASVGGGPYVVEAAYPLIPSREAGRVANEASRVG
jgi:hypothetical protein